MKDLLQIFQYISHHPLAGKHKFKAVMLFLRWQIGQKLLPYSVAYPYVGKTTLLVKKGQTGATGNIYTGLHEFSDMGFLLHFLRKEDLFIDVGANIGSYTVLASGVIGSKTISIEPVPQTFHSLRTNVFINELDGLVKLINAGLGSNKGKLYFTKDNDTVNHVVLDAKHATENLIEVEISSLDLITATERAPSLIKIDVEGFEQEVINGANALLRNEELKAIIVELNGSGERYGYDEGKIHEQLLGNNFQPYMYDPFTRKLSLLKTFGNHNTVYIRDLNFVEQRLKTAAPIEVFNEKF